MCDQSEYRTWTEWDVPGSANSHHAPGQIDAVCMVDGDRRPLVIDASHMPATSPEDLAEVEAILAACSRVNAMRRPASPARLVLLVAVTALLLVTLLAGLAALGNVLLR